MQEGGREDILVGNGRWDSRAGSRGPENSIHLDSPIQTMYSMYFYRDELTLLTRKRQGFRWKASV